MQNENMQNKEDVSRMKVKTHVVSEGAYVIIERDGANASYLVDSVESAAEDMMEHAKVLQSQAERALQKADLCKKAAVVLRQTNNDQPTEITKARTQQPKPR